MKGLKVLSIVDFVWVVFWYCIGWANVNDQNTFVGSIVLACAFPIVHAVFAYILSFKKDIKKLKLLSIIGFILFVGIEILFRTDVPESTANIFGFIAVFAPVYAIFLAIYGLVVSVKASKKAVSKTEG
jgi:cytosine/uracil/thiamine/allantoin permease